MKFLAFSDTHLLWALYDEIIARAFIEKVSFLVCVGDFSSRGRGAIEALSKFRSLHLPLLLVPGNHEYDPELMREVAKKFSFIINIDNDVKIIRKCAFMGCGASDWYWGSPKFLNSNAELVTKFRSKADLAEVKVLLTHCPPSESATGTGPEGADSGSPMIRSLIESLVPDLVLCGHLHVPIAQEEYIDKSLVVNIACRCALFEVKKDKVNLLPLQPLESTSFNGKISFWQRMRNKIHLIAFKLFLQFFFRL